MPNFPKPSGDLPEVLSPLNLRHYSLLAYWVYFRPTAFHGYLYQAAPDVYQLRGLGKFLQTWKIPAYRNIYLMLPFAIALMAVLVSLVLFLYKTITVQNNTAWVNAIAIAPNGQIAVTASGDRALKVKVPSADSTLKVWDLRSGSQMHTLIGHEHGVTDVALTPDGHKAISASRDRSLKVWDIRKGTQLHDLKGHKEWVSGVVITSDGQRAVSVSGDKTLRVWDIEKGTALHTLTGHNDVIWAVAVTPDGQRAVSASADRTLKVWDIEQGTELYTLTGHRGWVTGVALTPDGKQAISASLDNTLKVWDIEQGQERYTLAGHNGWVTAVAVSPDGKQAVSASADQSLKVWDIEQGKLLNTLTGHQGWVTSVAIAPNGKQAVSASSDQTMKVWDLAQATVVHTLTGHHAWVTAIAVLPTTPRLISASFQGPPKLWSLKRGIEQPMLGVLGMAVGLNVSFATALTLMVIGGAVSIAIILAIAIIALGIIGNITASVVIGFIGSLGFCLGFLMADRIAADPMLEEVYHARNISLALTVLSGILFGLLVGVAFALSSRAATGVFASIVFILVLGLGVGIVVACVVTEALSFNGRLRPGIRAGEAVSIGFNLLVALGALRLPIYPIQFLMALLGRFRGKWHPAAWDELLVLPVPRTQAFLQAHLQASEREGLRLVADVARNPFQRAWAQRTLQTHLHNVSAPLHFLYYLLTSEDFNTYLLAPVRRVDWQLMPTTRQVLLGELANQRVDGSGAGINQIAENLVWGLTWLIRDRPLGGAFGNRKHSPLTRFARLLYQLTYSKAVEAEDFNLSAFENIYADLSEYPGGTEIADSFEALATFLTYDNLSDLTVARDVVSRLSVDEFSIRPTVLTALLRLGEMGGKVKTYQAATTRVQQLATLAQITSALDVLDEDVVEQALVPEQAILRRIIRQWRWLVSQAAADQPKPF
jgi:WD40 repeat protein